MNNKNLSPFLLLVTIGIFLLFPTCRDIKETPAASEVLPRPILEALGPGIIENYALDRDINPCYFQADFDGKLPEDYVVFLEAKVEGGKSVAILMNGAIKLSSIESLTGCRDEVVYCKPVEHFPAGASLPANARGFIISYSKEKICWVYFDGNKWCAIFPD